MVTPFAKMLEVHAVRNRWLRTWVRWDRFLDPVKALDVRRRPPRSEAAREVAQELESILSSCSCSNTETKTRPDLDPLALVYSCANSGELSLPNVNLIKIDHGVGIESLQLLALAAGLGPGNLIPVPVIA